VRAGGEGGNTDFTVSLVQIREDIRSRRPALGSGVKSGQVDGGDNKGQASPLFLTQRDRYGIFNEISCHPRMGAACGSVSLHTQLKTEPMKTTKLTKTIPLALLILAR
jgi:hypothetical protein